MKRRSTETYVEILQLIKNLYFSEFGSKLGNKFFHSDGEHAFMIAVPKVFTIQRNLMCTASQFTRKYKELN
jgi:aromatic ring hydroxylase